MTEFGLSLWILVRGMAGVFCVTALIWGGAALLKRLGRQRPARDPEGDAPSSM